MELYGTVWMNDRYETYEVESDRLARSRTSRRQSVQALSRDIYVAIPGHMHIYLLQVSQSLGFGDTP